MITTLLLLSVAFSADAAIAEWGASPARVASGGNVTLRCTASQYFEYCTWKRESDDGQSCEFEWKRRSNEVELNRCSPGLAGRMSYAGDYIKHECAVVLSDADASADAGLWTCQVEDYAWGPIRGKMDTRLVRVDVEEEPNAFQIVSASDVVLGREGMEAQMECRANRPFDGSCSWAKADDSSQFAMCQWKGLQDTRQQEGDTTNELDLKFCRGGGLDARATAEKADNACRLRLKDVRPSDLGRWTCVLATNGDGGRGKAVTRAASVDLRRTEDK